MQFTEMYINKSLKPKENQTRPYDVREKSGDGFGMTIFPSGKKSFIYIYQFEGRKRRMTLGRYPHCSLSEARKLHRDALKMLESEKDPAFEKRTEKRIARDSATVNGLINEYIEHWAKPHKRSWQTDERCLNKDVKPRWGKQKASDITRRDIILLLDEIKDRGSPIAANRTLACVRRMFNFGIERDIISASPCVGVKAVAPEVRCDRVLSEDEIKILWHALDQGTNQDNSHIIHMSPETKLVLKLQLVTAQRKGEVVSAEWNELDLVNGWWTIPAIKAKNNQIHRVPLSSLALKLLNEVQQLSGESRFLFPAKLKDTHITGSSIDHAVRRSHFHGFKDTWTPHDCRRTTASHLTGMGIPRLVVSKILNHSENNSVTATYDRHSYDGEKRHALETWAHKLNEIVYGSEQINNVVNLKAAS